ncbi:MAG: hypothetical protein KDA24_23250 [Deltaproteobacteria bacterium]|nr:hypothetical protein [Deltaproteobacteria bacterium]
MGTPGILWRLEVDMVRWTRRETLLLALLLLLGMALPACTVRSGRGGGGGGGGSDDDDSASADDDDAANDDDASDDDDDGTNTDPDPDDDGLTTTFEQSIGTDPFDPDTDGDGFDDGEEHLNYFFADDPTDYPYIGDYPRGPIPASVAGQGWSQGSISNNWTHEDQHGQDLQLHRFYGNVVVVELAAEW